MVERGNGSRPRSPAGVVERHEQTAATASVKEMSPPRNGAENESRGNSTAADRRREKRAPREGPEVRARRRRRTKEDRALVYLLGGLTITETAHKLRVNRSTVHRWLNDPLFLSRFKSLRNDIVDCMFDQHLQAGRMATSRLVELMDSQDDRVAVRAAVALQAAGLRMYYFVDLDKRIEWIEDNLMLLPKYGR